MMHAATTRALLVTTLLAMSCTVATDDTPDKDPPAPAAEPACVYPASTNLEGVGSVMAPMGWTARSRSFAFERTFLTSSCILAPLSFVLLFVFLAFALAAPCKRKFK